MVSREEIWRLMINNMFKVVVSIITCVNIRTQVISIWTLYLPKIYTIDQMREQEIGFLNKMPIRSNLAK